MTYKSPRIVALDLAPIYFGGLDAEEAFQRLGEIQGYEDTPPELIVPRSEGAQVVLTNKVCFRREEILKLPSLKYLGILATGYNVVDLEVVRERGIAVTNVPGYASESVAQHVFAMVLNYTNRIALHASEVGQGNWSKSWCHQVTPVFELAGKTLGILGYGSMGKVVARIAEGFGMNIQIGSLPNRDYSPSEKRVPIDELLPLCDIVSLHCPLTMETERVINENFLALMKPTSVLVNTSRGGLIDEPVLANALRQNRIAHACLDVLSTEPPPFNHPLLAPDLWSHHKITITGHYAWSSVEARTRLIEEAARNLESFLKGERRNRVD